jgi:hypothetical protein
VTAEAISRRVSAERRSAAWRTCRGYGYMEALERGAMGMVSDGLPNGLVRFPSENSIRPPWC